MRILKFRAWQDFGEGRTQMLYSRGNLAEFFDATTTDIIMQFTGLLDKQGKEIYEGDILRDFDGSIFKVSFCVAHAQFMGVDIKSNRKYGLIYSNRMEIIGNIYEHNHLLKEDTNE
jgi:uncharacterized phage protein (TIGR01671 family)